MNTFRSLLTLQLLLTMTVAVNGGAAEPARWHSFQHENVLGTSLELKVLAASVSAAEQAETAVLREIDRTAKILSGYDRSSEFSQWAGTVRPAQPVSPELFQVLSQFDYWRERSAGALDASAETVCRLWKLAAARSQEPSRKELDAAIAAMRGPHWKLDAASRTATRLDDAPLTLNALAKGYIIDRAAAAALADKRISGVVVNIGGDLVVRGAAAEPVEIADPRSGAENDDPVARLRISNRAVATSGNYRRGVRIGDRWYSHIVDPRTGRPVDHIISATAVAPNAADADALATIFSVLTPAESLALAASLPEVECLLITKDGQQVASAGWQQLALPVRQLAANGNVRQFLGALPGATLIADKPAEGWDASELIINLELSHIEGQRYRRPFVAVWIEDQDKFPVRTLALWYNQPRWLPDLRSWQRGDRLRALADGTDITRTVSGATRPPGKYALKWDGKDDKGKSVKPGKYTVCIEAAREHGTYQIIRQEMEFTGVPKQVELKGNQEVNSASLDYHRKTNAQ